MEQLGRTLEVALGLELMSKVRYREDTNMAVQRRSGDAWVMRRVALARLAYRGHRSGRCILTCVQRTPRRNTEDASMKWQHRTPSLGA